MVSAGAIEKDEILTDGVRPITCGRFVANNTLTINATIENALNDAIWVKGNLTLPADFIRKVQNKTPDKNSLLDMFDDSEIKPTVDRTSDAPYLNAGVHGITSYLFKIENRSTSLMEFNIPVDDTFLESMYYNLELTWGVFNIFYESKSEIVRTKTFQVTPFEWVDQDTMQPVEMGKSLGNGLQVTNVVIPDTSIWKGDPLILEITLHNYGSTTTSGYINAKVREVKELYIGFDMEVTVHYGYGLWCIPFIDPGETITIEYYIGPYLQDIDRGVWALNGAMDAKDFTPEKVWYGTTELLITTPDLNWEFHTEIYPYIRAFSVKQNPNKHVIFAAVVDDETYSGNVVSFFEEVLDNPIRIGQGMQLEPETTFEEEFGFDFRFYYVDTYNWPDFMYGLAGSSEALRNTKYALGEGLGIGSCWTSGTAANPNTDLIQSFTQRENHGFDIGLGFMPSGFWWHNGEGLAITKGTVAVVMGASIPNYPRVKECALHEICHLFGAKHGQDYPPGDKFGSNSGGDGYDYIMATPSGDDVGGGVWRMHDLTRDRINEFYHCYKFDGAAYPQYISNIFYGQVECRALFGPNQEDSPIYQLRSDGLFRWTYNPSDYTRFIITDVAMASPENDGRSISSKYVNAEISYPDPGKARFFVAYELAWESKYWPSSWTPSNTYRLDLIFWMLQYSSTTGSTVDNVQICVLSEQSSSPMIYYSGWFKSSDPTTGSPGSWVFCYNIWGKQKVALSNQDDTSIWILFGISDVWVADWYQKIWVHPIGMVMVYDYISW